MTRYTLWAVKDARGEFEYHTVSCQRFSAVEKMLHGYDNFTLKKWRWWYNRGYRAVRVEIRELPPSVHRGRR
jgi:hypothetical protein